MSRRPSSAVAEPPRSTCPIPTPRFKPAGTSVKPRLILSVDGQEGTGKTHFALTAPGPIGYLNFDIGAEGVVDKFVRQEKAVAIADYRLTVPAMGRDGRESEVIQEAIDLRQQVDEDYREALRAYRTVVVDTASELWALYRMAEFGRVAKVPPIKYEEVNTKFKELIRLAYESDANLILIHQLKDVWTNNQKTGERERSGFGNVGYLTQVNLSMSVQRTEAGAVEFAQQITKCRPNADLLGLTLTGATFAEIAGLVYPEMDESVWA